MTEGIRQHQALDMGECQRQGWRVGVFYVYSDFIHCSSMHVRLRFAHNGVGGFMDELDETRRIPNVNDIYFLPQIERDLQRYRE